MGKKKKGNGKYHEWITEEGLLKIEGWARDGLTDIQIAKNIGIAVSTLNNWKNKYVELMESLKRGKEVIDRQVENALLKRALGYEYEEVKQIVEKDDKGKDRKRIEKTVKQVIPDTTAQIFWLKNRKPVEWRNKHIELEAEEQKLRIKKLKVDIEKAEGNEDELSKLDKILEGINNAAKS